MDEAYRLARRSALLAPLSDEDIRQHLEAGLFRMAAYGKNSVIHLEGEPCQKLEIILSGQVVVERIDESGRLMTITAFTSDDILGGNLLFSQNPAYPMTVSTRALTFILEIGRETLFALFRQNDRLLRTYLEYVSDHASILGDRIRLSVSRTIRESLLDFLEVESRRQGSRRIRFGLSKKALAERLGVQRTSLSRELAKMRKDGLIVFDADTVTLL